jgi:hypothetical protein
MSSKRTQLSETDDNLNCTVLALKSVTGWKETKCQRILDKAGRERDKGFDIDFYLTKCKGRIEDVEFKRVFIKERHTHRVFTLKQFADKNPIGVYYVCTKDHALAIINGVIVDNQIGFGAREGRGIRTAYKVTGNIKPNIGKVTKADKAPKRLPRLNYGEEVIFNGPQIKYGGKVLAKKGDLISIDTQRVNGICIAKFIHYGKKVGKTYPDYYSITAKIDRTLLQTTKERDIQTNIVLDGAYFIERGINLIK